MPNQSKILRAKVIQFLNFLKDKTTGSRARLASIYNRELPVVQLVLIRFGIGIVDVTFNVFTSGIYLVNFSVGIVSRAVDSIIDPINNFGARGIQALVNRVKRISDSRLVDVAAKAVFVGLHLVFGIGMWHHQDLAVSFILRQARIWTSSVALYGAIKELRSVVGSAAIVNMFTNMKLRLGSSSAFDFSIRRGNSVAYVAGIISHDLLTFKVITRFALAPLYVVKAVAESLSLRMARNSLQSLELNAPVEADRTRLDKAMLEFAKGLVGELESRSGTESFFKAMLDIILGDKTKKLMENTPVHKFVTWADKKLFPTRDAALTQAFEEAIDQSLVQKNLQPIIAFLRAQNTEFENFATIKHGIKWNEALIRVLHNNKYTQDDFWAKRGLTSEEEQLIAERNPSLCSYGSNYLMRLPITISKQMVFGRFNRTRQFDLLKYLQIAVTGDEAIEKFSLERYSVEELDELAFNERAHMQMQRSIERIKGIGFPQDKILDEILDRTIASESLTELVTFVESHSTLEDVLDNEGNLLPPLRIFDADLNAAITHSKYNPANSKNIYADLNAQVALIEQVYPELVCIASLGLPLFYVYLDKKKYENKNGVRTFVSNNGRTHMDLHSALELFATPGRSLERDRRTEIKQVLQPETKEPIDLGDINFDPYHFNLIRYLLSPDGQQIAQAWISQDMPRVLQNLQNLHAEPITIPGEIVRRDGAPDTLGPSRTVFKYPLIEKYLEQTNAIFDEKDEFWPKNFTQDDKKRFTKDPANAYLLCPITRKIMRHPVAIEINGEVHRFEFSALLFWLSSGTQIPGVIINERTVDLRSLKELNYDFAAKEEIAAKIRDWQLPPAPMVTTPQFMSMQQPLVLAGHEVEEGNPGLTLGVPNGSAGGPKRSITPSMDMV